MIRFIPLPAMLLFLLLLNLVHALDNTYQRHTNVTFLGRDYTDFRNADPPDDDDQTNEIGDEKASVTTRLNDAPTITTIIIIQTSGGRTYHELGGSTNTGANSDNGATDPNDDIPQPNRDNDDSALKRLISIPTVVGGVAIAAIIGGTIVFMRLRAKRRRAKALRHCQELSSTYLRGNEGDGNGSYHVSGHQRQYSNSSTATNFTSHQHHPYLQSSLPSPSHNQDYATNPAVTTIVPSAPLEPTISPAQLRERHILSSLSQQLPPEPSSPSSSSSTPIPSAPSTKELEMHTLTASRNVPHITTELQQPSSSNYHHPHMPPSSSSSSSSSSPSPTTPSTPHLKSKDTNDTLSSSPLPSAPDMPPPAYTASAPPLFVLPPNQRRRSADQLSLDKYKRS